MATILQATMKVDMWKLCILWNKLLQAHALTRNISNYHLVKIYKYAFLTGEWIVCRS
jgi:hypothetical protein